MLWCGVASELARSTPTAGLKDSWMFHYGYKFEAMRLSLNTHFSSPFQSTTAFTIVVRVRCSFALSVPVGLACALTTVSVYLSL